MLCSWWCGTYINNRPDGQHDRRSPTVIGRPTYSSWFVTYQQTVVGLRGPTVVGCPPSLAPLRRGPFIFVIVVRYRAFEDLFVGVYFRGVMSRVSLRAKSAKMTTCHSLTCRTPNAFSIPLYRYLFFFFFFSDAQHLMWHESSVVDSTVDHGRWVARLNAPSRTQSPCICLRRATDSRRGEA